MKQTKKLQHSFCNILCIKTSNTTQKSPKQNIYAFWNIFETSANNYPRKSAKFTHAHTETNLARGANDEKNPNAENSELFKIKKIGQSDFCLTDNRKTCLNEWVVTGVDINIEILVFKN